MTVPDQSRVATPTRTITPSLSTFSIVSIREETIESLIIDENWARIIEILDQNPSQINDLQEDHFLSILREVRSSNEIRATHVYQLLIEDPKMDRVSRVTLGAQTILKSQSPILATEEQIQERINRFLESVHIERTPERFLERLKTTKVVQKEMDRRKGLNHRIQIVKPQEIAPPGRKWFCCKG